MNLFGSAFQTKGLGVVLYSAMKRLMAAWNGDRKEPKGASQTSQGLSIPGSRDCQVEIPRAAGLICDVRNSFHCNLRISCDIDDSSELISY
jgi:hypothetical protein